MSACTRVLAGASALENPNTLTRFDTASITKFLYGSRPATDRQQRLAFDTGIVDLLELKGTQIARSDDFTC